MCKADEINVLTRRKFLVGSITAGVTLASGSAANSHKPDVPVSLHNFFNVAYDGARTDLSGSYGFEFIPQADLHVWALGRAAPSGLKAAHEVTIWDVVAWGPVAATTVTPQSTRDEAGYAFQELLQAVILKKGHVYRITSSELTNSDPVLDIAAVDNHSGIAHIVTGAFSPQGGFAAFTYGFENRAYGLPTFFVDAVRLPSRLLKPQVVRAKPLIRDRSIGYLIHENFCQIQPYCWPSSADALLSGWNPDKSSGTWQFSPTGGNGFDLDWFKLTETRPGGGLSMSHQVARQNHGVITLEFRFTLASRTDGVRWQLADLEKAGVSIYTDGESLCWQKPGGEFIKLQSYHVKQEYGVKVVVDIGRKSADVYINGRLRARKAPFCQRIETVDFVEVEAPHLGSQGLYLSPVNIHKGYVVNDTFVTDIAGSLPDEWHVELGTVSVEEFLCQAKPDVYSLRLAGTARQPAAAHRAFPAIAGKVVVEFCFILPQKSDGLVVSLGDDHSTALELITNGGDICLRPAYGAPIPVVRNYRGNLWHMVKLIVDTRAGTVDAFVNGKPVAASLTVTHEVHALSNMRVVCPKLAWVDDIQVYPWEDFPADYVPEPEPCAATSPYLVGLQSCPLSSEGNSYCGWDYIYPLRQWRKPYLGWYDDNSAEAVDWQIKWQVEHGISFEMICWYRPSSYAVNQPVKTPDMTGSILKGLFNARWSHYKKFAIMYTDDNGGFTNPTDFRENLVPYWIEYFFKDPRYVQIDGKPVICLYYYDVLARDLGGLAGVRSATDFLRQEAKNAGFPDLIILTTQTSPSPTRDIMKLRKDAGFDALYSYTWFTPDIHAQQQQNVTHRTNAEAVGLDMVGNIGPGWDNSGWSAGNGHPGGGWCSPEQFRQLATWARDEYMPGTSEGSLGRTLLMLDNWCEFGEGHFLMPANLHGFGYLDAVREVFTADTPHKDEIPTLAQQRRFTVLYPRDE